MYHSQAERETLARDAILANLRHAAATERPAPSALCQRAADAIAHEREAVARLSARLKALRANHEGERLDLGAPGQTGGGNRALKAVDALHGAAHG